MLTKQNPKYVFIAGGIGITPFRSMIKYMIDKDIHIPITVFYVAKDKDEFLFQDLFKKAHNQFGLQIIYILSHPPKDWDGEVGYINENIIKKYIDDSTKPTFYISGPQTMVENYRTMLGKMGINILRVKTDLFTGYTEDLSEID
jgi:predicted ferric reductase